MGQAPGDRGREVGKDRCYVFVTILSLHWRGRFGCALVGGRAELSPTVGLGFTNADVTPKVNACARAPGKTFLWTSPQTHVPTYVFCYVIYLGISEERQAWEV